MAPSSSSCACTASFGLERCSEPCGNSKQPIADTIEEGVRQESRHRDQQLGALSDRIVRVGTFRRERVKLANRRCGIAQCLVTAGVRMDAGSIIET